MKAQHRDRGALMQVQITPCLGLPRGRQPRFGAHPLATSCPAPREALLRRTGDEQTW